MAHKDIFLVPYAHLDTQWRWEYPTTIKKYVKRTIEENLSLFMKYPEHRFNFTGAIRYAMMKEYYPDDFLKVKALIEEYKWFFVGTCLDETDTLVPSVESMVRNILYGDRWAKKELGKSSRDYMIPDCFGFPANMSTVLTHCGISGFSSQKLTWNSAVGIPFELGKWKGPDGADLISVLNPTSYVSRIFRKIQKNRIRLKHLEVLGSKNRIWKSFQYYGVGDIGGAPKEGSVKKAIASIHEAKLHNNGLRVRQGSPDQFFNELTTDEKLRMDEYSGDLLLINHSAGTLTSAAIMKRWNRKNEHLAFAAEVAAVFATVIAGVPYPAEKIKSAWYKVIGSQMHDILPGTSTPTAYEYSQNDEVIALTIWTSLLEDAASHIAPYIPGNGEILLFNPLGEKRQDIVEIEIVELMNTDKSMISVIDSRGSALPAQVQTRKSGRKTVIFIPIMPPFSWKRFSLNFQPYEGKLGDPTTVRLLEENDRYILENVYYRVSISYSGKILSVFHKDLGKELLKAPLAYEFQKERPKLYPSWNMDWKDRKNSPFQRIESGGLVSIIEKGPLRCTIQITTHYNSSVFVKEISLGSNSKIVEFTERIHWKELGCSLKLALTVNMAQPTVMYNWETSRINRGVNHPKQFEVPSRLWVDMSEGDWGVSLIEDSKYGYDHPSDDTLRMTLLYTPGIRPFNGFRDQKYHDWGDHTIRYGIYGHSGGFNTTDHLARRFNVPIRSFRVWGESSLSFLKEDCSLFTLSSEQIAISALKKAEDSEGIILRLYERYGKDANALVSLPSWGLMIKSVQEVNGLEEFQGNIACSASSFEVHIPANGIRTYYLVLETKQEIQQAQKVQNSGQIAQLPIHLEYNVKIFGQNGDKQGLYPLELVPSLLRTGTIDFHLSNGKENNAVLCQGQIVSIPEEFETLSILIGAKEACDTIFKWLDSDGSEVGSISASISSMTKKIGQWDSRIWKKKPKHHEKFQRDYVWFNKCVGIKPGYINRDRMEWYATHTHKNGQDQYYQHAYMFRHQFTIPAGAKKMVLPINDQVFIFAMTISKSLVRVVGTQYLHDKYDF